MKRPGRNLMVTLLATLTIICGFAEAASSSDLLQQGLYAEEVEGNLPAAITNYEKIVNDPSAPSNHVAQSLYHEGMCYLKLKDEDKAAAALTKLVKNYADQTNLVAKAKPVLANLQVFDPATLMPPDTLAYLELGSLGKQLETLLGMLKDTPFANPLSLMAPANPNTSRQPGPGMLLASLLNPSMLAEFKKIRGAAIGITDIGSRLSFVAVLHPGKSDALRGIIMSGLGVAGTPGPTIEGMTTLSIQKQIYVAYDDKVIIAACPGARLPWCIRQYKHITSDTSLASNKSFSRIDKGTRRQNAATVWIDTDGLYARILQDFPNAAPMQIKTAAGLVNIASIDDLVLTAFIKSDGLGLDAIAHFKEDLPNMAYELIRTPAIRGTGLKGVPADAVGLASFSLAATDSMQTAQLRQLAVNSLGMELPTNLFENVEQISLFALPGTNGTSRGLSFRPGLVVSCKEVRPVMQFFKAVAEKRGNRQPPLVVEATNGVVIAALSQDVITAAITALEHHTSVNDEGSLHAAERQCIGSAQKMFLMNIGGYLQGAATGPLVTSVNAPGEVMQQAQALEQPLRDAYGQLDKALESTILAVHTEESPHELAIKARLNGIPPLSKVVEPIMQIKQTEMKIARIQTQIVQAARQRRIRQMKSATICSAPAAPVIDGKLDEVWKNARIYKLDKTLYASSNPTNRLAADYRMMWDATNLYVFIDVTDSTPTYNPDLPWQFNDGIELYLDATNSKSQQFGPTDYEFSFLRHVVDSRPEQVEIRPGQTISFGWARRNTKSGYSVEAAFPWKALGVSPAAGNKIGVDVQVNDNQSGKQRDAKIGWFDSSDSAWRSPSNFGQAELAGLVGYWPCDAMEGTTLIDKSGRGHNGTFHGNVKWTKGRIGGALDLDGKNSYVQISDPSAFDLTGEITIACWVNFRSIIMNYMPIVTKGNTSWRLSTDSNREARFHLGLDNKPSGARVWTDKPVGLGEWHHVTATYDGKTMQLYVDGNLAATRSYDGGITSNNSPVMIGANADYSYMLFDGQIDDVRVYNRVLSSDEIKKLATVKGE